MILESRIFFSKSKNRFRSEAEKTPYIPSIQEKEIGKFL